MWVGRVSTAHRDIIRDYTGWIDQKCASLLQKCNNLFGAIRLRVPKQRCQAGPSLTCSKAQPICLNSYFDGFPKHFLSSACVSLSKAARGGVVSQELVRASATATHAPQAHPDFLRTPQEIYLELFRYLLQWSKVLNLLLLCSASDQDATDGPSWVPDWSIDANLTWLDPAYLAGRDELGIEPARTTPYEFLSNGMISVYGRQISTMDWRCRTFRQTSVGYDLSEEPIHIHNIGTTHELIRRDPSGWKFKLNKRRRILLNIQANERNILLAIDCFVLGAR